MKALTSAISAFRSGEGLKGQLLRGGAGSIAIKIGSTGLNVLLAIVLARALGAEGFGVYSFVFALITIMAIPAQMGLPNLVVRETAKARAAGDWALMKGLWRWSTLMAMMMSTALMAMGALAAWMFSSRLPESGLTVLYWGLVLVPLIALGNLRGAALRGLRHVVRGQLPEFILRPAFLTALVLGAHLGLSTRALTASDAMMLHALASLLAFVIGAWLLLKTRPWELTTISQAKLRSVTWLKSAVPLGMVEGTYVVNQNVGVVILGIFSTTTDVGFFKMAALASTLVSLGLTAINMAIAPHIAALFSLGEKSKLQRLMTTGARLTTAIAVPIALLFLFYGRTIFEATLGSEFSAVELPLLILCIGQMANAATGSVGTIMAMTNMERQVALTNLLSFAVNVGLAIILVPMLGILGAALAASISLIALNFSLTWQVYLRLGVRTSIF